MITTVVGNYPKVPSLGGGPNLRTAINRFDEERISREALTQVVEQATADAISEQVQAGIDLVTDGHLRWDDEITYFTRSLTGVTLNGLLRYFDSNTYFRQPIVEGAVAWKEPVSVADYQYAVTMSAKPVKAVLPGPFQLAYHCQDKHYNDVAKLAHAAAEALNAEARALQAAGASFIQFNDPVLLKHKDQFPLYRELSQKLTAGVTAKTALYTYFGDIDGLYPQLFDLPFQVFGLDFVAGDANFNVLKSFPSDRELGFGVVDARNTKMESIEDIVKQLDAIVKVIPLERIYLNPTCGLEFLPRSNAYEKLARISAAAQRAQEVLV